MKLSSFAMALIMVLPMAIKAQPSPPATLTQSAPPTANDILKQAFILAGKEHKNVFVMFHASWCGWCHRMDSSMNDKNCKKFFDDNFVICHLVVDESTGKKNLENPGADDMRNKYYGAGQGIPFWLVFDKDWNLLADSKMRAVGQGAESGQNIGCPAVANEVEYFISILKKTSNLNSDQLEIIRKRFRENEQ